MIGIKVTGVEKLTKALNKETIRQPLGAGIKKITLLLDRFIKQSTPVDTGRLRSSIHSEVQPLYGKVGTIVQYAQYVELGTPTGTMKPRHVSPGSQVRILGEGMFSAGSKLVMEKFPELLSEIGAAIQSKWNM